MLKTLAIASGTLFLGYCVYFDWKRHKDPDFQKKLAERSDRKCKIRLFFVKKGRQRERREELKKNALPVFKSPEEKQLYIMKKLEEGEKHMSVLQLSEAVESYCLAICASDGSTELIQILSTMLPPELFQVIVNKYREKSNSQVD